MPSPEDEVLDRKSRTRIQGDLEGARRLDAVHVRLLGSFTVRVGSRVIQEGEWHLKKAANLIKLLAKEHRLHRDRATGLLWPDLGHKAATNNPCHALHVAHDSDGIEMDDSGTVGNRIEGNLIGTKSDGTGDLGNTRSGVKISGASGNFVGGSVAGAGNAPINLPFEPEQAVSAGEVVTATATRNATGDTSEFSQARQVQ